MFVGNNFFDQIVSFGICWEVVFSRDKIYCLDPWKQPQALANLWTLHKFQILTFDLTLPPLRIEVFQPCFARWKTWPNDLRCFSGSRQFYIWKVWMFCNKSCGNYITVLFAKDIICHAYDTWQLLRFFSLSCKKTDLFTYCGRKTGIVRPGLPICFCMSGT